tara:strand:- start:775 stop:1101 length:327 start_codon:yes stop_codon:yes gene_type:complete
MTTEKNGWGEYSRLVLKELETLSSGIQQLRDEIQDLKTEITAIKSKEEKVQDLLKWKERIDEIVSPSQLKELQVEVESLRLFKTKAITAFCVAQFIMGTLMAVMEFFL